MGDRADRGASVDLTCRGCPGRSPSP